MNRTPLQLLQTEPQQPGQQEHPEMLDAMVGSGESSLIHSHKLSLRARKWKYRGEGNANVVIALPQREIVRLHKAERGAAPIEAGCSEQAGLAEQAERERVMREVLFCRQVMVPLLGGCYLQPPAAARLDNTEVRQLSASLQSQRPAHRHHKDLLCGGGHVTLYPDYALLPSSLASPDPTVPTFCVEVKPKQGWIPQPDRLMPKCTFCMKQFLKLKNECIPRRSNYCPLDLFSGEPLRMQNALRSLLQCPQNNLKIFKNGVLIYGEDIGNYDTLFEVLQSWFGSPLKPLDEFRLVNRFCSVVLEALTRDLSDGTLAPLPATATVSREFHQEIMQASDYSPKIGKSDPQHLFNAAAPILQPPCDWSWQQLPANCVLDRVLRVQMLEQPRKDWELPTSPRARKDYAYVGGVICDSERAFQSPLHRYLVAATAKDCSILLAFQPVDRERAVSLPVRHIVQQTGGNQLYVFNVGVSDLDPKPVSCVEKHRQRDMEMLMACVELAAMQREAREAAAAANTPPTSYQQDSAHLFSHKSHNYYL